MNLLETCMQEQQNLEQDGRQNPDESGMQAVQAGMEAEGRQDVQPETSAEVPDEAPVETTVPEAPAETPDAPADGIQNGRQIFTVEESIEGPQGQAQAVPDAPAAGTGADILEELMPPKREKPVMENVTIRLEPGVKNAAKALAHERGLSLSVFCAQIIDRLVRKAAEKKSQAA